MRKPPPPWSAPSRARGREKVPRRQTSAGAPALRNWATPSPRRSGKSQFPNLTPRAGRKNRVLLEVEGHVTRGPRAEVGDGVLEPGFEPANFTGRQPHRLWGTTGDHALEFEVAERQQQMGHGMSMFGDRDARINDGLGNADRGGFTPGGAGNAVGSSPGRLGGGRTWLAGRRGSSQNFYCHVAKRRVTHILDEVGQRGGREADITRSALRDGGRLAFDVILHFSIRQDDRNVVGSVMVQQGLLMRQNFHSEGTE